jgi:hypothetical protein
MAGRTAPRRGVRNTAPLWKKLTLIVAAVATPVVLVMVLNATKWNFFLFALLVVGSAAAALWLASKLVGVRLSLANWDDAPRGGRR